jgi:hypothetical protein
VGSHAEGALSCVRAQVLFLFFSCTRANPGPLARNGTSVLRNNNAMEWACVITRKPCIVEHEKKNANYFVASVRVACQNALARSLIGVLFISFFFVVLFVLIA